MKKHLPVFLCAAILAACITAPVFSSQVKDYEITRAVESKPYYNAGDIIVLLYDIKCENGIGGFTFNVQYDGDNFDLYDVSLSGDMIAVNRDDHVGTVEVGAVHNAADFPNSSEREVKAAVSFRSLYMLDSSYITFDYNIESFANGSIKHTDNYTFTKELYIYDTEDMTFENYIDDLIFVENINSDIESDTESNTDSHNDKDTERNTDSHNDKDTESNTDSQKDKDTERNTDSQKDKDTESNTDSQKDKDTERNTNSQKDKDTESNTDSPETTYIFGDIDGDNIITSLDALLTLRYSVKLGSFTPIQEKLADVDGDKLITASDSLEILRYSVGIKSETVVGNNISTW